ncbi:MAG: DUF4167 domain-containing protein [Pseudomonadota bacterium]
MKRQRGRNRRSGGGGNNPNRHFESNGPDVKIRGSAQQVLDKYLQYARDAQTSGDRVMSEAYFQHAEHYQRLLAAMQPKDKPRRDTHGEAGEEGEAKSADAVEARSEDGGKPQDGHDEQAVEDGAKPRRQGRSARAKEAEPAEGDEAPAADPLKVIDGDEGAKPRRRRTYRKRGAEAEDAPSADADSDGVMKTLSRGRPQPDPGAEADAPSDARPAAPAAE